MWPCLCPYCEICNAYARMAKWSNIRGDLLQLGYLTFEEKSSPGPGDIPLAFIITLTATAPFTTEDQALGIAYISIIMVWCFLTMFPLGGWMLVKRDFDFPEGPVPDVEEARHETGVQWFSLVERIALRCSASLRLSCTPTEDSRNSDDTVSTQGKQQDIKISLQPVPNREGRRPSISHSIRELDVIRPASSHASVHHPAERELEDLSLAATPSLSRHRQFTTPMPTEPFYERAGKSILRFLLSLVSPPAIACLLSLTIALVPQLKALFVTVPGVNMPDAPDGQPPLAWILDIAVFGGKSVPCCV